MIAHLLRGSAMIVAADPALAEALRSIFGNLRWQADVVRRFDEAAQRAIDTDLDLLIVGAPTVGWTAEDVYALVRSHEQSLRQWGLPMVAVSHSALPEDHARLLSAGFVAHLSEPVRSPDIEAVVERVKAVELATHRNRPSVDRETVLDRLAERTVELAADESGVLMGLALSVESEIAARLCATLLSYYRGEFDEAARSAQALASAARGMGAWTLAWQIDELAAAASGAQEPVERAVVVARAEVDRVVYTLRQQAARACGGARLRRRRCRADKT